MAGTEPMVLVYDTRLSQGTTIILPLNGQVNVIVDWGDGTNETGTKAGELKHAYTTSGEYIVKIGGSLSHFGGFSGSESNENLTAVTSFGDLGLTSLSGAFSKAPNLTSVPTLIPATVTDLSQMFHSASKFNQDVGK